MDIYLVDEQTLRVGSHLLRCTIGKGGLVQKEDKREGDLCTPQGIYPLRACYYRPDKMSPPETALPLIPLREDMGWCDDSAHARYNQLVRLPFTASHEKLWREDDIYDVIVPLGYNDDPIVAGKGSAIFLHIAKPDYEGTEGCVALSKEHLLATLSALNDTSCIHILP